MKHASDARPLFGAPGFLLHDRGEDQRFLRRLDHDVGVALFPHLREELRLSVLHALNDVAACVFGTKAIRVGEQRALLRNLRDVSVELGMGA